MKIVEEVKLKMKAALEHFKGELRTIRTGRASPGMVEHVSVEAYGSLVPLKSVANISCPEPSQLLITPFDPKQAGVIGKSIEKANLGFMPIVDGVVVRVKIPSMTQEVRKKMVDLCRHEKETAKVTVRSVRRDANTDAKKQKSEGVLAEDLFNKVEKEIQKLTDDHCLEIDKICEKKEEEILKI